MWVQYRTVLYGTSSKSKRGERKEREGKGVASTEAYPCHPKMSAAKQQLLSLGLKEIQRRLLLKDDWTKQAEAILALEAHALANRAWLTEDVQRLLISPVAAILKSERSALVKEAVGAVNSIATFMGTDFLRFAVEVFRELLVATGTGAFVLRISFLILVQ
jgi:hypothetical protein